MHLINAEMIDATAMTLYSCERAFSASRGQFFGLVDAHEFTLWRGLNMARKIAREKRRWESFDSYHYRRGRGIFIIIIIIVQS